MAVAAPPGGGQVWAGPAGRVGPGALVAARARASAGAVAEVGGHPGQEGGVRCGQLGGLALRHQGPDLALHLGEGGLLVRHRVLCAACWADGRLAERRLGLALGRLQVRSAARPDGDWATLRASMAPEMSPLATDWYSPVTVACSPPELNSVWRSLSLDARHVRGHGLLAEAAGVGRDVGLVRATVGLDL